MSNTPESRALAGAAKALQGAIDLLSMFYESPSLAHTRALVLIDKELPVLRAALAELARLGEPPAIDSPQDREDYAARGHLYADPGSDVHDFEPRP